MKVLDTFDFDDRPSRSRYAAVVKALVEDGKHAVMLERGDDFPDNVKMATVQAGVSTAMRKAGQRAKTRVVSPDKLVVGINPDQVPRKRGRRLAAV